MSTMQSGTGWSVAHVDEVPPVKPDWPDTWKSIRHHFGVSGGTGFGDQPLEQCLPDPLAAELRPHIEAFGFTTKGIERPQGDAPGRFTAGESQRETASRRPVFARETC